MVEFTSEADVLRVAPTEYADTKDLLEEVDVIASDFKDKYHRKDDEIEHADVNVLTGYVVAAVTEGQKVIEKTDANGLGAPVAESFIRYVRRRLHVAMEQIYDRKAVYDPTKEPVTIDALQLPSYAEQFLRLERTLHGLPVATDYSDQRENFRSLKIQPAAFFVPEIRSQANDLAAKYPGLMDDEAPLQRVALLSDPETNDFGLLVLKMTEDTKDEITDESLWIQDNKEALVNLLKLTQSFEGNDPATVHIPHGLILLREAFAKVIEEREKLVKQKAINPSLDVDAPLKAYNLTKDRINEIVSVINLITVPEQLPQFTAWRDQTIRAFQVYPEGTAAVPYQKLYTDIKKKTDAATELDEAKDVPALKRVIGFLRDQQTVARVAEYPVADPGSEFNQQLQAAKIAFLEGELEKWMALKQADDHKKGRARDSEMTHESESATREAIHLIYKQLHLVNSELPVYEEIKRFVKERGEMGAHDFMQELVIAFTNYAYTKVFNTSNAGGGQVAYLPNRTDLSLWDGVRFEVTTREIEAKDTIKIFFRDFPWREVMPELKQEDLDVWFNLWQYRFLHIDMMHNYAAEFDKIGLGDLQKPDTAKQLVSVIGTQKGNKGGYFPWDLVPFYKRVHEEGANPQEAALHQVFEATDGEERYWRLPELLNYFVQGIEFEVPDLTIIANGNKGAELTKAKEKLIAEIPEGIRVRGKDGKFRDTSMVEIAWMMAIWTSFVTLRIFDYDDSGLDSKIAWWINTGAYAPKVVHSRMNTSYEWCDTGAVQLERIWPTRSDFIHFYVDLAPERYVRYDSIGDLIEEKNRLKAAMATMSGADKDNARKKIAQLEKFIIETRQVGVGEYQDLSTLENLDKELSAIDDRLRNMPPAADRSPADQEEYDRLESFALTIRTKWADLKAHRPMNPPDAKHAHPYPYTDKQLFALLKKFAWNTAVDQRYAIIRIKPEFSSLHDPANPKAQDDMPVIRVPWGYFEFSARMAATSTIPRREDYIALSDRQIMDCQIDPRFVRYDSVTPQHALKWAGAANDSARWMEFLNVRDKKSVFTPIHESRQSKVNIARKTHLVDWPAELSMALNMIEAGGRSLTGRDMSSLAERTDQLLREKVVITHMTVDDLSKEPDNGGMGFARITQSGARYWCEKLNSAGPVLGTETPILPVTELWLQVFRKDYHGHHDGEEETFRELRQRVTVPDDLRREKRTTVPEGVRIAADVALSVSVDGKPLHQAAQNQIVVESFIIALGMYLDKYRYKSVEEGHSVVFAPDILEHTFHEIKTLSENEPMDFAHRELLLEMCEMTFESFLGPDFGGEGFDPKLNKKIIRRYSRELVENMMRERGLIGTTEQYVVDRYYYEKKWGNVKEAVKDEKKH